MNQRNETNEKNEFRNLKEVAAFLRAEGWKISQSTVYEHGKHGMIRKDRTGVYLRSAVLRYAGAFLATQETGQKQELEDLQRRKVRIEIEQNEENLKLVRLKREREEGNQIPRHD